MTAAALVAGGSKKAEKKAKNAIEDRTMTLKRAQYICYLIWFKKNKIQILLNSGNEVNAMTPAFASNQSLKTCYIDAKAQKIDSSTFLTFRIILANFRVEDKLGQVKFFQKLFLLAKTSIEIVLEILFSTLSNTNIKFT